MSSGASDNKNSKYWIAGGVAAILGIAGLGVYLYSSYQNDQEAKKEKIKGKKPRPGTSSPEKAKDGSKVKAASSSSAGAGSKAGKLSSKGTGTPAAAGAGSTKDPQKEERDNIILVLEKLLHQAMIIVQNFPRLQQQFQARAGAGNPQSQKEIMAVLHMHYEHNMQLTRTKLLKIINMTDDQFEQALQRNQTDSRICELFGELAQISQNIQRMSADDDPELQEKIESLGEEYTLERTQEIFVTLMEALLACMEEAVNDVNSRDPPLPKEMKPQEFQKIMMEKNEEVKKSVLDSFSCDEDTLDLAIRKYQHDPQFQETFMNQQRQQQMKVGQLLSSFS